MSTQQIESSQQIILPPYPILQCWEIDSAPIPVHDMVARCKGKDEGCVKTIFQPCPTNTHERCCHPVQKCTDIDIQNGLCYRQCDITHDRYCYKKKNCTFGSIIEPTDNITDK